METQVVTYIINGTTLGNLDLRICNELNIVFGMEQEDYHEEYDVKTDQETLLIIKNMLLNNSDINRNTIYNNAIQYFDNNISLTELFIEYGLVINHEYRNNVFTNKYIELLVLNGVHPDNISCFYNIDYSAIHGATPELARMLIGRGATLNFSQVVINWRLIPILLEYGMDVNTIIDSNKTILMHVMSAAMNHKKNVGFSSNNDIYFIMTDLVEGYGASLSLVYGGYNPLGFALVHEDYDLADWLVEHGAKNPIYPSSHKKTLELTAWISKQNNISTPLNGDASNWIIMLIKLNGTNPNILDKISNILITDKTINVQEIYNYNKQYFNNNIPLTQLFISYNLKLDITYNKTKYTNEYIELLVLNGVHPNKIDLCMQNANITLATLLIDKGVMLNFTGVNPTWLNWKLIPLLLRHGMNINAIGEIRIGFIGSVLLYLIDIARKYYLGIIDNSNIWIDQSDIYIILRNVVQIYGADVDKEAGSGLIYNPLGFALINQDYQMADWLVDNGANVNEIVWTNRCQRTPELTRWLNIKNGTAA